MKKKNCKEKGRGIFSFLDIFHEFNVNQDASASYLEVLNVSKNIRNEQLNRFCNQQFRIKRMKNKQYFSNMSNH